MAKDLPYFKFFVSEWTDGDITLENYKTQGVFINICSYYWSKECSISFNRLLKRFNDCSEEIDSLFSEQIIKRDNNDNIVISFLDEQLEERQKISKRNSKSGKISAEKRKLKKLQQQFNENSTSVKKSFNKKSTNKRREEKRREDIYTIENFLNNWNTLRTHYLKTPSRLNKLPFNCLDLFDSQSYSKDDWQTALKGLFKQEYVPQEVMHFKPKHFLENVEQYLDAEKNKKYNLYSK